MANPQSPSHFNGYEDDPLLIEANFTQDISEKMRVPKRIKATGEYSDEDTLLSNQNGIMNSWNYSDKISMNVPDRIVVIGQDQHLGTRSAPREIVLENSILPKDPGLVRVATPPRIITLSEHHFPTASDEIEQSSDSDQAPIYIRASAQPKEQFADMTAPEPETGARQAAVANTRRPNNLNDQQMVRSFREDTPPLSVSEMMNPSEEILHLRRQLAKLNRRVLSVEIENVQRQQREKIVCVLGIAYFLLKAIFWLNRN
ncbi:unnamed protein product [Hermetia illucens]|uniref:Mff-like domain-containing protein n=1 Tax=Hermetia illucens TaxID=343691 RepID=A0A7R8YW96_HERIL|nr:transport and Golgi organization protein 11 [Hermetia illucens]CAD7088178.1 unnamed protein product [Hermetia illucens]